MCNYKITGEIVILPNKIAVVGLGATGQSVVNFLPKETELFLMDERENLNFTTPANAKIHLGGINLDYLLQSELIILSPGIALSTKELIQAKEKNIPIIGDIELFCKFAKAPIIAITGSNGKSTVSDLTYQILKNSGIKAVLGGNFGIPALDLLKEDAEIYVLELSSFQLETTSSLEALASTVLNITPDHMDRYDSLEDYQNAKLKIYENAKYLFANVKDPLTFPPKVTFGQNLEFFGKSNARVEIIDKNLVIDKKIILALSEIKLLGEHNLENILVSCSLAVVAGADIQAIKTTLQNYYGLEHRLQRINTTDQIIWINDSKATNIGSTIAAVKGLKIHNKLHLILGGDGKNADFSPLQEILNNVQIYCYCFGKDGTEIAKFCKNVEIFDNLQQVVKQIKNNAQAGDLVLLSPACASWDQFKNYAHRGKVFMDLVKC